MSGIESGDPHASAKLLPLVYDELRNLAAARMASERPDHTLQTTALIHEAYLRLVGDGAQTWVSRGHFLPLRPRRCARPWLITGCITSGCAASAACSCAVSIH
ncbi:MAG: ECF-type sigma factor [Pirellulaceae bacterium]